MTDKISINWDLVVERLPNGTTEIAFVGNSPSDYIAIEMPFVKAVELRAKLNAHILDNQRDSQP